MTTIIIDRESGIVATDSRCSAIQINKKYKHSFKYPFISKKTISKKINNDKYNKIFKLKNGDVFTACGSVLIIDIVKNDLEKKGLNCFKNFKIIKADERPSRSQVFIINKDKNKDIKVAIFEINIFKIPFTNFYKLNYTRLYNDSTYLMAGSGGKHALNYFDKGLDPVQALFFAINDDEFSGGMMQVLNL